MEQEKEAKYIWTAFMVVIMMCVSVASVLPSDSLIRDVNASGYPNTYDGDEYITISTGWNFISFGGDVTFDSDDVWTDEHDPVYRTSWSVHGLDIIGRDDNWDASWDELAYLFYDDDDWLNHHWEIKGDLIEFQPEKAYWIHSLVNCYIHAPCSVNSFYSMNLTSGSFNAVGLIGEDSFWDSSTSSYRNAHYAGLHLYYASNSTIYYGNYTMYEWYNPNDGYQGISANPPGYYPGLGWYSDGEWSLDFEAGEAGAAPQEQFYVFNHVFWHTYELSTNFGLCNPYFQDHAGLYVKIPSGTPALQWKTWPGDGDYSSPNYSTPP